MFRQGKFLCVCVSYFPVFFSCHKAVTSQKRQWLVTRSDGPGATLLMFSDQHLHSDVRSCSLKDRVDLLIFSIYLNLISDPFLFWVTFTVGKTCCDLLLLLRNVIVGCLPGWEINLCMHNDQIQSDITWHANISISVFTPSLPSLSFSDGSHSSYNLGLFKPVALISVF